MKDVIARTGLTDRAIRLYISRGLIVPKHQKSYTGRDNYSFTNEDVDQLKRIALLRRADFSLEQISKLQQENAAVGSVLRECLLQKWETCEKDRVIVGVLESLCAENAPTLDQVYRRFSECFEEQEVPCEDAVSSGDFSGCLALAGQMLGSAVIGLVGLVAVVFLLLWGITKLSSNGNVYETTRLDEYLEITGNYNDATPKAFIQSFFPEDIDSSFSQVVYHYKAKKGDTYAYECYLEFVIEDPEAYRDFIASHIGDAPCTTFLYDAQFQELSVCNELDLHRVNDQTAVYSISSAKIGKILFSDTQQRIIFVSIGMYDGGGANTVELGHFFNRFQIDPWEYSQSACSY